MSKSLNRKCPYIRGIFCLFIYFFMLFFFKLKLIFIELCTLGLIPLIYLRHFSMKILVTRSSKGTSVESLSTLTSQISLDLNFPREVIQIKVTDLRKVQLAHLVNRKSQELLARKSPHPKKKLSKALFSKGDTSGRPDFGQNLEVVPLCWCLS